MSEEMVVRQCAPTLAGIKAGSLFPCPCTDRDALLDEVRQLNRRLSPKGLCLLPLRFTEGSALLYLYRPATLRRDLSDDLARRLLAEAGYADGLELELGTYNDDRADAAVVIQAYLAEVGINVTVTPLEMAAFGERAEAGEFDIWYCGWSTGILPDDFLVRGFRSDGIFNYSQFQDPEYDTLIDSAIAELDETRKAELYGEAQTYLAEQYVYYPMYTLKRSIITTPDISGDPFTSLTYPFNFQNLTME